MFNEKSLEVIFKRLLLEHSFQFPLTWAWIGANGGVLAGRFEWSVGKGLETIILSGKPKTLRYPVNAMIVDRRGVAAHILFKGPEEISKATLCRADEPSIPWPKDSPKA
ncbi:MAG: hypothetical protein ACE144_12495 [Thermodesulfobacteriota bacterium]